MAEWPLSLPDCPLLSSFEETVAETRLRTQMDAGPAKVRNRFRAGMDTVSMQMGMTSNQVRIFEAFYKNTLEGGSQAFDFTHPRTLEQRAFRFVSPPKWTPENDPGFWRVQMELEYIGTTEALSFVDLDFQLPGNSGYIPLLEDI